MAFGVCAALAFAAGVSVTGIGTLHELENNPNDEIEHRLGPGISDVG
jgi:hypothetical protein